MLQNELKIPYIDYISGCYNTMDLNFLSYALMIETILLLIGWIVFLHWRISKHKKALNEVPEVEPVNEFDVYMQYLNRELSDTKAHLDDLAQNESDDVESINMYQYRLKHLDAEHKAMAAANGEIAKFWEIYRSNIEFIYTEDDVAEDVAPAVAAESLPETSEPANQETDTRSMQEQLESYRENSAQIIEQSDNVIDLVKTMAAKTDSEELRHMLGLLEGENEELKSRLAQMQREYEVMMHNAGISLSKENTPVSLIERDEETVSMASVAIKQNQRISELNDIVGDLSIELAEKTRLMEESQWVTRQMKEMEHVIIILEDENAFLRGQIKQLLA